MKRSPSHPQRRGLTLIELMIGLAIMAVLMSLAVPSLGQYLQRQRLKAAAQGLEADLKEARFEAARRGSAVGVVFNGGADWCYAITTSPDCDCRVQQACRLKTVRGSDLRGLNLLQPATHVSTPPAAPPAQRQRGHLGHQQRRAAAKVNVSALGRASVCLVRRDAGPGALLRPEAAREALHLHVHDVGVGRQQPVAHLHGGLEADLALLHGHHGLFQADGGVVEAELALQPLGAELVAADVVQRLDHGAAEAAAISATPSTPPSAAVRLASGVPSGRSPARATAWLKSKGLSSSFMTGFSTRSL
jgi:type IV fimbrial biogenesis protein FimT